MFYNRLSMKRSALDLLKHNWKKAAFMGFLAFLPMIIYYCIFFVSFTNYQRGAESILLFSLKIFFSSLICVCVSAISFFAMCRWNIQLAKNAQTDGEHEPLTIKDYFKFYTPISIGLFFLCFIKYLLWFLLVYVSIIPMAAFGVLAKTLPVLAGILTVLSGFLFIFLLLNAYVKLFSYSMSYYALADDMSLSVTESVKFAVKTVDGFRTNIFVTYLSFMGWYFLGFFTLGIAYFWIIPYLSQTMANSWLFMKAEKERLAQESQNEI